MTVAELLVKCLESEGVKYVFGVPGEENEALLFALDESETIEFIPTRHEQGAAFMADVWGRLSGQPGVCLSTLGPGATNLLTGVADAHLDKAPLVAITGQGSLDRLHHESHQKIDVIGMFEPVTKWNSVIRVPETTAEIVRKAFKTATLEKPGSTHIELPENIAEAEVPDSIKPIERGMLKSGSPDQASIREAVDLLASASRPMVLAGNGAIRNKASEALCSFIQHFNIPVVSTFMGKGAIPDHSPQSLLAVGLNFKDYVIEAFDQADVILAIGYDIAEYAPDHWNASGDQQIIHVDFEPAEVYNHYQPKIEIIANIETAIRQLHQQLESNADFKQMDNWWSDIRQRILEDIKSYQQSPDAKPTVPGALLAIREHLDDNGLIISDVGSHKMWIARNWLTHCPNGCIISNGLASMGISLPGAIAAKLLYPDRPVIALMGDGGFLMNVQEIETATRLDLKFPILVFRDDDYGLISWKQRRSKGRSTYTRIGNPDLVKLAESFGIKGFRANEASELIAILKELKDNPQLALIDIPIDTAVNDELIDKLQHYFSNEEVSHQTN